MKFWGAVLVILGLLALVYGEIGYSRQMVAIDMGSMQATATEHQGVPLSPLVGALAIVSGLLLMITPSRRLS
jgi:hypothetical protein